MAMASVSTPQFMPGDSYATSVMRPTKALPRSLIDAARVVEKVDFDPALHISFSPPMRILSMSDIGYSGSGISSNAVTEPFSLFTEAAVKQMRAEIFSQPVLEHCQYASRFASNMIRGFGPTAEESLAPFIFDAWHSPEVLEIVSRMAGIELIPALDYDVGHINISIDDSMNELQRSQEAVQRRDEISFDWHFDSYPFVCVTMLSDCAGMVGGETAIKTASGEVIKVRGPAMGTAVVMQGRYIEHQALKARGGRERIVMVTSFRPKSPHVKDETVLTGVRTISYKPDLYRQYSSYRLEILEERIRAHLKRVRSRERFRRDFDIVTTRRFLAEQKKFLEDMLVELE